MKQTIEQSILCSLQKRVNLADLENKQCSEFEGKIQKGDEIWYFKTPKETWTEFFPRCGLEGYALIRNKALVAEILTSMS